MSLNFSFSDEQLAFKQSVKELAQKVALPGSNDRDREGRFDRDVWNAVGDFGLCDLAIPEKYGGLGADIVTTCLARLPSTARSGPASAWE